MQDSDDTLYTTEEVAEKLKITPKKVREYIKRENWKLSIWVKDTVSISATLTRFLSVGGADERSGISRSRAI